MTETGIRMIMASIALSTTMGVFVHDSQLDKAAVTALKSTHERVEAGGAKLAPELHTHAEHTKLKKHTHKANDPRDKIRNHNHKKAGRKTSRNGLTFAFLPG